MEDRKESSQDEKKSARQMHEVYSSILSAIPHALIGLRDRTIFFANQAVENVFGWKPDEITGKNTRLLYQSDKDYEEIGRRFYTTLEKQRTHTEDFPCVGKEGRVILCRMSASVIGQELREKGIIIMYEDITRLKGIENELLESEKKYRAMFENTGTAMIIIDEDTSISLANAEFSKISGYSRKEIEGKMSWTNFILEKDIETMHSCHKMKGQGHDVQKNHESKLLDKHCNIKEIALTLAMIPGTKKRIASITDITERKRAEKELMRYRDRLEELVKERTRQLEIVNEELGQSNIKLQELDRLKSMFIASMSHELRTPLNSIIGFTGILLQEFPGPLNDEQKKQLGMVKGSSHQLLDLITDIIDLSKIEAGKIEVSLTEFDMMAVIREVLALMGPSAARKNLPVIMDGPEILSMQSDQRRIRQVLVNLVGNAVKFTEQGEVRVSVTEENGTVQVAVQDTGPGIRAEDMSRLFQFFSQITSADMPKLEGTGLGLYLSKKLMKLLNGDITAKSEFGKGSVFSMTMPLMAQGEI